MSVNPFSHRNIDRLNLSNLSPTALRSLRSNPNLTIKPADKGGAFVAWRTHLYITEARHQLSDTSSLRPLDYDPTPDHKSIIFQTIHNLITSGGILPTASYLIIPQPCTA
eukprot:g40643.t1